MRSGKRDKEVNCGKIVGIVGIWWLQRWSRRMFCGYLNCLYRYLPSLSFSFTSLRVTLRQAQSSTRKIT